MNKLVAIVALVVAGLAGCGGDDKDPAVAACEDFVFSSCSRIVECVGGVSQSQCEDMVAQEFDCAEAEGEEIPAGFNDCLDDLESATCEELRPPDGTGEFELPASCE
jgi:hypothetical protein